VEKLRQKLWAAKTSQETITVDHIFTLAMGQTPHIHRKAILLIISRTVKSERLGKRSLTQRPTDGAGDSHFWNKKSSLTSPVARMKKVSGAGRARISIPRAPAFPIGGVRASACASLSALRVSEIRYRRLFEAARDGVLLPDPRTRKITDANPFMIEILGYPHEGFVGRELLEIGLLKDQPSSRKMFRELQAKRYIRYEHLPLKSTKGRTALRNPRRDDQVDGNFLETITPIEHDCRAGHGKEIPVESTQPDVGAFGSGLV